MTQDPLVLAAQHVHIFLQYDLVLGQGAGLVRAENVHLAKGLDGAQALDDGLLAGHVYGAFGQGGGHNHRQHLRHDADGDGDAEHQGLEPVAFGDEVGDEDDRHHDHHEADQQAADGTQVFLKAALVLIGVQALRHAAEIGLVAGGQDHALGAARNDIAAHEPDVVDIRQGVAFRVRAGEFLHGIALAGQLGLVDEQVLGLDEAHVAGNHVAGGELDDIAGNGFVNIDFHDAAVADDVDPVGDHLLQFLGGVVGFFGLDEGDDAGNDNDQHQHDEGGRVFLFRQDHVRKERHQRDDHQDDVEGIDHRVLDPAEQAVLVADVDDVPAVFLQPVGGLHLVQALRVRFVFFKQRSVFQTADVDQVLFHFAGTVVVFALGHRAAPPVFIDRPCRKTV